jgi:serine/threonine protein kinase
MHSRFIAHLDLKIGNIMGRTTSAGVVYKLIDFGYAQMMPPSGSVVIPNKNYGTYPYKPPEVVQKSAHGLKSDIWSLGGIAWFLSLQYTPFYLDNYKRDISAYKRFINSPTLDPGNHKFFFSRHTSNALKSFIKLCMQIDVDKRPSAKELLSHPFITGETIIDYRGSSDEVEKDSSSSGYESAH